MHAVTKRRRFLSFFFKSMENGNKLSKSTYEGTYAIHDDDDDGNANVAKQKV